MSKLASSTHEIIACYVKTDSFHIFLVLIPRVFINKYYIVHASFPNRKSQILTKLSYPPDAKYWPDG